MDRWGLRDFKSVVSADVALDRRLSLIAGSNSSGKSSIIQSLLVFAQTVQARGGVVLNGPLVRLGSGADVIRRGQSTCSFVFAGPTSVGDARDPVQLETTVSLEVDTKTGDLVPATIAALDAEGALVLEATRERANRNDIEAITSTFSAHRVVPLRLRRAPETGHLIRTYLIMRGFTPIGIGRHFKRSEVDRLYSRAMEAVVEDGADSTFRANALFLRELSRLVPRDEFPDADHARHRRRSTYTEQIILSLPAEERQSLALKAASKRFSISEYAFVIGEPEGYGFNPFARMLGGPLESELVSAYSETLALVSGIGNSHADFATSLEYLGPLRDEPRVVHSAWDLRTESLPVGSKGELTAEVLHRSGNFGVRYVDPGGRPRSETLRAATGRWCKYLGIGTEVRIVDHAKLGRGVEITVDGVNRDLTAIGVGASQLLPVVVAVLQADQDEEEPVLVVEQPELHLHPAVQARLGDFFTTARPDLRLVVETHSEALLTRVRRRIAEETLEPTDVQVLFVEQKDGNSSVRPLALDDYGSLDDWPEGFFDDRLSDAKMIARALARRLEAQADST